MSAKKVYWSGHLEAEQVQRLREVCSRTNVPMSVYVRRGVDLVLAELRREAGIWDENGQPKTVTPRLLNTEADRGE